MHSLSTGKNVWAVVIVSDDVVKQIQPDASFTKWVESLVPAKGVRTKKAAADQTGSQPAEALKPSPRLYR